MGHHILGPLFIEYTLSEEYSNMLEATVEPLSTEIVEANPKQFDIFIFPNMMEPSWNIHLSMPLQKIVFMHQFHYPKFKFFELDIKEMQGIQA